MSIPNKDLVDQTLWEDAQSTVNGQPNDQALDEACYQKLANRDRWLRNRLNNLLPFDCNFSAAFSSEKDSWSSKWKYDGSFWILNMVHDGAGPNLYFPLSLPVGSIITAYKVFIQIPTGHSALPAQLPQAQLSGVSANEFCYATAANVAAYESLTQFGNTCSVVATAYQQMLTVLAENGANAKAGMKVSGIQLTVTSPFAG